MSTSRRPQCGKAYSREEIDALFAHLPDEPFQTPAIVAAVEATGIWQGRSSYPGAIGQTLRLILLARGELVVVRREGPRHVWMMKGRRLPKKPPLETRETAVVYVAFRMLGLKNTARRSVRIHPEMTVDEILAALRPALIECHARTFGNDAMSHLESWGHVVDACQ